MKVRIKALIAFILLATASVTILLALPHVGRARLMPPDQFGSITLDPSFNAPFFATPDVTRSLLLPGGKYVSYFLINTLADQPTGCLIRFNSNGSLDTGFSLSSDYAGVTAVASASGGQLIVAASHPALYGVFPESNHSVSDILRLNADGSVDPTFGPAQATDGGIPRALVVNGDGTILVAGLFTQFNGQARQGIVRLLANGSVDPGFAAVSMTASAVPQTNSVGVWTDPVIDANNKILIAGDFIAVNGTPAPGIARLNSDGTLDMTFNASGFASFGGSGSNFLKPIRGLGIQSDNKIIIGGRFVVASLNRVPLVRLNTDGSRDTNFAAVDGNTLPPFGLIQVRGLVIQPDDKVIAIGLSVWRFNTDGSLDGTFHNPELLNNQDDDYPGEAFNISFASGGSLFVSGQFSDIDDAAGPYVEHWGAAKLNANGTLDPSFTTSHRTGNKIEPTSFARGPDGFTLVAFNLTGFHPTYDSVSHNFGRLLSNGMLDPAFDPIASFNPGGPLGPDFVCSAFTPLPDGSLLLTGTNGNSAFYGRLLPDGNEDENYQADPNLSFTTAFPRSDGKIIVDNSAALINADGTIDGSFQPDPAIKADKEQRDGMGHLIAVYKGGGVLALTGNNTVLGSYLSRDGTVHLVRLTSSGSIDPSFPVRTFPVSLGYNMTSQFDSQFSTNVYIPEYYTPDFPLKQAKALAGGKVLLVGSFASYGGTPAHGIVRINSNGSIDSTFNVGGGAQWTQTPETGTFHPSVDTVDFARGGNVLLAGLFEAFNGTPAPGIINLNPNGSVDNSFVAPVQRQLFDYQPAYLKRQIDGSFLLSGPYSRAGQTNSPSFFHLQVAPDIGTPADLFASINRLNVQGSGAIFEFTPAGAQSTFAAPLVQPRGMAFDSSGNLFVTSTSQDSSQGVIVKFDPNGAQTTFANVIGPGASLFLSDLKIDNAGNIFVAAQIDLLLDPNAATTIYKFTPDATQSTFGFVPSLCLGIAFDSMGNLYASDAVFKKIYKFLPDGRSSIFVDTPAFNTDEGPAGLTFDPFDNLFVTSVVVDSMQNVGPGRILKFAPNGTRSTFATGLDNNPRGLVFDSTGNLFVAERPATTTGDILEFDPNGVETTFASGLGRPQGNGGPIYVAFQPFPVIKGNPSASATNGSQFIYQIAATNHPASYAASGLPPGLVVDPAGSGIISGVPTVTGNFQVSISALNLFGTGSNTLDLTVQPAPSGPEIISSTTATGRTGEFFRFQVLTSGTTSSALLTTSALPPGLSANSTTALISGTTTANGTFNITLTITDGGDTATGMLQLTFTSDPEIPIITSGDTASLVPGQFFSYTLTADANASFSYIGTDGQVHTGSGSAGLPPNLMYDAPSHTISGIFMPSGKMNRSYRRSARPIRPTFSIGQPDTLKIRPPGIGSGQTIGSNQSGTGTNPLNFFEGYFVTVRAAPSNRAGSVSGGYNEDLSVTLMAAPNTSYGFQKWTNEDGSTASTSATYTFTPTSDRTLKANFIVTGPTPTPPPSSTPKPNPPPGPSATPRPSSTPK